MKRSKLNEWLKLIRETQPEEISCSECFEQVSTYVDHEISGKSADTLMPQLKQHITQCGVCREEYELIRQIALAEAGEDAPDIEELRRTLLAQRKEGK